MWPTYSLLLITKNNKNVISHALRILADIKPCLLTSRRIHIFSFCPPNELNMQAEPQIQIKIKALIVILMNS